MPFGFRMPGFPNLPKITKDEIKKKIAHHADLLKQDMIVTIITKNPNNRDIVKEANSNMSIKQLCDKVDIVKEGEYWKISLYLHLPLNYTMAMVYFTFDKDPKTKRDYPDRKILIEVLDKKEEVKP
jgi:hypothetical protein